MTATALLAALMFGAPAIAQEPGPSGAVTIRPSPGLAATDPSQADTVRLNFPVDSSLMTWVRFFADLRRMTFVIPDAGALEQVQVTIISNQDVSPDAAWEAFLSALAVEGYTVGLTGQTAKIVEIGAVRTGRLGSGRPADSDAYVTQLFAVGAGRADELGQLLSSLLGADTKFVVYPPTDTLIVTGPASSLRTVDELLESLDVAQPELTVQSYPLAFADEEDVQKLIEQVYGDDPRYTIRVFVAP